MDVSSVQFTCLVVSNSLRPHESQHARTPCPSPTPRVHPHPCPSSQRCLPTISSSVGPFTSHLQSFPASGSFQMNQFQGTLKSLLQHHSSKASILWCSAFFIVQLSHPYMTIGKTIALTRWIFVGNVSAF